MWWLKLMSSIAASEMEEDDDDDQLCPICFDSWKGTGEHRIVSLKCGHLFGKSCVERWLRKNKKCPKCNAPSKMQDIRPLFAPTIKVKEAPEEQRLLAELNKALAVRTLIKLAMAPVFIAENFSGKERA
jgi:E3 ubiquitin-protein ligase RFWD3